MKPKLIISLIFIISLAGTAQALTVDDIIIGQSSGQVLGASTNGLVGYWNFDEGNGTTAADTSGNSNAGTLTGTTWTAGKVGSGALTFNGSSSYVDIANESNFDFDRTQAFSVSAWIYHNSNAKWESILSKQKNGGSYEGWDFRAPGSTTKLDIRFTGTSADVMSATSASNSFSTGGWYHVAFTYDGSSSSAGLRIYVNAVDRTSTRTGTLTSSILNNPSVRIGSNSAGGYFWSGNIDDVRIYNRELTAQEISDVYNDTGSSPSGGSPPPAAGDTTAPVISNISISNIAPSSVLVSWTTDENSDTQVEYGATTNYGSSSVLNSSMVTSHSVNLSGLSAATLYHYIVKSRDAAGNLAVSADNTFTSAAPVSTNPASYTAASCSQSDVNAIINGPTHVAVDGDTINIPAGTCNWTKVLSIKKGISIIGSGPGSTIIQHGFSGTAFTVNIPSATSPTFRLSAMSLEPTTGSGGQPAIANIIGACNVSTCTHIRLDNLNISGWLSPANFNGFLFYANNVFGVIDHNIITVNSGGEVMAIGHSSYGGLGSYGDNSWAQPDSYGTDNTLYFENNIVSSTVGITLTDTDVGGGARFVVRFNNLNNVSIQTHGTESTGRIRGGRQYEVYGNAITVPSGLQRVLVGWRSGTGLVFSNTKSGPGQFTAAASLSNYREGRSFSPWGNCNGQGPYDNNDGVVYASGVVTSTSLLGTSLSVTDTTKTWAANEWVATPPFSVVDLSKTDSSGFHPGAQITSSLANAIASNNYGGWNGGADAVAFGVGDSYQIIRASACLDQPGRGGAGAVYLSGYTPSPTGWANQPLDPIYEWGNAITGGGNPTFGWVSNNATKRFVANKDYYSQVTPFTGAAGTGYGTLSNRPTTCTTGVAYWATDQGSWNQSGNSFGQGILYQCASTNNWTAYYTPYVYPHPLVSGSTPPGDPLPPVTPPADLIPPAVPTGIVVK